MRIQLRVKLRTAQMRQRSCGHIVNATGMGRVHRHAEDQLLLQEQVRIGQEFALENEFMAFGIELTVLAPRTVAPGLSGALDRSIMGEFSSRRSAGATNPSCRDGTTNRVALIVRTWSML